MKIRRARFLAGSSAFFFDDQRAIKDGAVHDGFAYAGSPVTAGFSRVRQAGRSVLVVLELEDGRIAAGDCAAVQYSGAGGRDPLLDPEFYVPFLERNLTPFLEGRETANFRQACRELDALRFPDAAAITGAVATEVAASDDSAPRRLHTALRYGLSQALLAARAESAGRLMAEIVAEEWALPLVAAPVPVFGQTGDDRYLNADKMILKGVDVLPHGLINNVDEKLGRNGEKLRDYLRFLANRVAALRTESDYRPCLHVDVYGTIGKIFGDDPEKITAYLDSLRDDAAPLELYIEGPVDMEEKLRQIDVLLAIKRRLEALGSPVKIVADEWCNTLEDIRDFADADCCHMIQIKTPDLGNLADIVDAVLYCKAKGVEAYQGGTCNETDLSARACVHLAMAARPDRLLAKPGMGFDEAYCLTVNEMARIGAVFALRGGRHA